jgi:uncharacterized protein DUF6184
MQTKRIFGTLTAIAATVAAIQGCSQQKAPVTPETTAERRDVDQRKEQAVDSLADAQCNRAERCKEIGPKKDYGSRDQCLTQMRHEAQKSIGKCNKGIDRDDLAQCVGQIQSEGCGSVSFEGLTTWIACDTDDLCLG